MVHFTATSTPSILTSFQVSNVPLLVLFCVERLGRNCEQNRTSKRERVFFFFESKSRVVKTKSTFELLDADAWLPNRKLKERENCLNRMYTDRRIVGSPKQPAHVSTKLKVKPEDFDKD